VPNAIGRKTFLITPSLDRAASHALCNCAKAARPTFSRSSSAVARVTTPLRQSFATPDPLTAREREVLGLMTNGLSNTQIAEALDLGEGTVRNHVSSILSKPGVADGTKAVLLALQQHLV
jgi:DNA-binding NarL/FixJ family response regulator